MLTMLEFMLLIKLINLFFLSVLFFQTFLQLLINLLVFFHNPCLTSFLINFTLSKTHMIFMSKEKCICSSNYTMLYLDEISLIHYQCSYSRIVGLFWKNATKFHYSASEIKEIMNFENLCVRQFMCCFVFNDTFYSQIEGLVWAVLFLVFFATFTYNIFFFF